MMKAEILFFGINNINGINDTLSFVHNQNNPEIVKIKPWNKAEDGEEKKYSLGFYVSELEKDEFFFKLRNKDNKIPKQNTGVRK